MSRSSANYYGGADDYAEAINDPGLILLDPADLDRIPPADINTCVACQGRGIVVTWHNPFQPHLTDDTDCPRCKGTGQEPSA